MRRQAKLAAQGDERDHIILSIGYGPIVKDGTVPQRFGPINNDQGGDPSYGQRRLNVAITRARKSFTVVHSILPAQITAQSKGARTLRRFLEFAMAPATALAASESFDPDSSADSDFEDAVARALRLRGYEVQLQVGVAGYRIDLAVWSPNHDRFVLGIECDGWTYHSSPTARDRDWLRQQVLEELGWRIHRVWSTSWAQDATKELDRIEAALRLAIDIEPQGSAFVSRQEPEDIAESGGRSPEEPEFLFPRYEVATIRPQSRELRFETHSRLTPIIQQVVEQEGPIHGDVLLARLRNAYSARATEAVRDNVFAALYDLVNKTEEVECLGEAVDERAFYVSTAKSVVPRRHGPVPARRSHDEIHDIELQAGLVRVADMLGTASSDELARETGRQFGFDRVPAEFTARLESAIDQLISDGALQRSSDGSVAPRR
jgi:very-short-patch-repair endonuclease